MPGTGPASASTVPALPTLYRVLFLRNLLRVLLLLGWLRVLLGWLGVLLGHLRGLLLWQLMRLLALRGLPWLLVPLLVYRRLLGLLARVLGLAMRDRLWLLELLALPLLGVRWRLCLILASLFFSVPLSVPSGTVSFHRWPGQRAETGVGVVRPGRDVHHRLVL